jgi:putative RNA 2'-phosphotransferase
MTKISKFLSLVLRHNPGAIGLHLDGQGWAEVEELLARATAHGNGFTLDELHEVVAGNDKKRFTLSEDGSRIRAAQGHSVKVELALPPASPPEILWHGTATRFLTSILHEGLTPQSRQHVHLSAEWATAVAVGRRHGKPVVLKVQAAQMAAAGFTFWQAANGVWLCDRVPPEYLEHTDAE